MPNFTTPGVFIQEVSTIPPSVAPVATAVPGFVGYTATMENSVPVNKPTRITSFVEFEQLFGGPQAISGTLTVDANGTIEASDFDQSNFLLYYSVRAFYDNGGGTCYVVSAGNFTDTMVNPTYSKLNPALAELEKIDEVTLLVVPDATNILNNAEYATIVDNMLTQASDTTDRFAIIDVKPNLETSSTASPLDQITTFRNITGINGLDYGGAYYPPLISIFNPITRNDLITIASTIDSVSGFDPTSQNNKLSDLLEEFEALPNETSAEMRTKMDAEQEILALQSALSQALSSINIELGPSGPIAGIYSRVDSDSGVFSAPANVSLTGLSPKVRINNDLHGLLNVDPGSGKSVNAIRDFAGRGTLVFGARTLDGNSNEFRYINVRRLFIFLEESIANASEAFVFEPNVAQTWERIRGLITNFLTNQWRIGALAGAQPSDAFFVEVGLGTTMTAQDILEGVLNVEIGIAPVRPAEFIVLRFSQLLQVS